MLVEEFAEVFGYLLITFAGLEAVIDAFMRYSMTNFPSVTDDKIPSDVPRAAGHEGIGHEGVGCPPCAMPLPISLLAETVSLFCERGIYHPRRTREAILNGRIVHGFCSEIIPR